MQSLATERCFHHAAREAAARCPGCARYFCRECVTEHEDRVLCAACLKERPAGPSRRGPRLRAAMVALQSALSVLVLWWFFYLLGRALLAIPSSFHDGTLWKAITEGP